MRSVLALSLLFLVCTFVPLASEYDAVEAGVVLYEVNIYNDDEGVSLHNYSSSDIDLKDYCITDNPQKTSSEGSITFSQSLIIHSGETLTFVKDKSADSGFPGRYTTYRNGESGVIITNNFALNNSKDDVYLFYGNIVMDALFYGSIEISDKSLWSGETFTPKKNCFAVRMSPEGGSASGWSNYRMGQTNLQFDPDLQIDAAVHPFLFPESGGIPIYNSLEDAKTSVCLTMYQLSCDNIYALLQKLSLRGVDVTVLLEESQGYSTQSPSPAMTLVEAGCTVKLIGGVSGDRYNLVHAKYCIIDGTRVIVTSENWTWGNLDMEVVTDPTDGRGNRGWGVIIDSPAYAAYMMNVFESDMNGEYGDVVDFTDVAPYAEAKTLTYVAPTTKVQLPSYQCKVTPILSPDNSKEAQSHYICNSVYRVFSQQQSLDDDFLDRTDNPYSAMVSKTADGIDCKLILSTNVDSRTVSSVQVSSRVNCIVMDSPYVHNKGIICDDTVLVGSVNWTYNSLENNREVMVAIHSKEVSGFFAGAFIDDFERNDRASGLILSFAEIAGHYNSAGRITVTVEVKQSGNYTYHWNLDGTVTDSSIPRTVLEVSSGTHILKVTATDYAGNSGSASAEFTVDEDSSDSIGSILPYAAPLALVLLAVMIATIKIFRGRSS